MKYPIGTQFIPRGRNKSVYTVVDCLTTRNLAGEIIKQVYLCEHDFLGQKVKSEEAAATIARGLQP
jgi:hypothetical protein